MQRDQKCVDCLLKSQCAYTRLFETFVTEPPTRFLKGQIASPRPFVLECHQSQTTYRPGDELSFNFVLFGDVVQYMPYIVFAVYRMAQQGLGADRHPFRLKEAHCLQPSDEPAGSLHWKPVYDGNSEHILFSPQSLQLQPNGTTATPEIHDAKINFLSPTRIVIRGELVSDFTFRMLVFKMLRRILELAYFYEDDKTIEWEFNYLLEAASDIQVTQDSIHWSDRQRYSNRQRTQMKYGGFVGQITLHGTMAPFIDILKYSEVVHVGKGATFGHGQMEVIGIEHG